VPTGVRGDSLHDQPRQSNMEKLTLIILTMALSLTIESGTTSADEISRFDYAQPVEPKIKEIHVENVRALTGTDSPTEMKSLDVCGTDLGTMTETGNRIFFAFGDTFGYDGDICRGIGGQIGAQMCLLPRPITTPQIGWSWRIGFEGRTVKQSR
jgi:hypothetical protein